MIVAYLLLYHGWIEMTNLILYHKIVDCHLKIICMWNAYRLICNILYMLPSAVYLHKKSVCTRHERLCGIRILVQFQSEICTRICVLPLWLLYRIDSQRNRERIATKDGFASVGLEGNLAFWRLFSYISRYGIHSRFSCPLTRCWTLSGAVADFCVCSLQANCEAGHDKAYSGLAVHPQKRLKARSR